MKQRLDQLLVSLGLAVSREQAQRLILAGSVRVNDQVADKPGRTVPVGAPVTLLRGERFVSRGGEKLDYALRHFQVSVHGLACLDVGASTGGFTDCLLQHGATRVYALDVGAGQLHSRLNNDPRVTVLDKTNARYISPALFPEKPALATVDVSFISLTKILPAVKPVLSPAASIITLIKPQFEAGRQEVGRGGVVRDAAVHARVAQEIREFGEAEVGLHWLGICESPLRGPAGNKEFLACWKNITRPE